MRRCLGEGESTIVNVSQAGEPLCNRGRHGFGPSLPSALLDLALEVSGELGAGGRVAADIAQRELLEPHFVQRPRRPPLPAPVHRPFCATLPHHQGSSCRRGGATAKGSRGRAYVLESIEPTPKLTPPGATPTLDDLPRILAEFETIGEALDYAAKGRRGLNFHDARGSLTRAYPYSELRDDALVQARRLITLGIKPGDRVALIAETGAEFAACFFGAVYAGAWPVPLPLRGWPARRMQPPTASVTPSRPRATAAAAAFRSAATPRAPSVRPAAPAPPSLLAAGTGAPGV